MGKRSWLAAADRMSNADRAESQVEEDGKSPNPDAGGLSSHVSIQAAGLASPEAPVWLGDGCWLVVEMDRHRGCITFIDDRGDSHSIVQTGRPNGLALVDDGSVLVAESLLRAFLRVVGDWRAGVATWTVLADRTGAGDELWFPNDLCLGPDGYVYATDSGLPLEIMERDLLTASDPSSLPFDGRLYRYDPRWGDLQTVDAGLGHLNGISIGSDGAIYINDTISGDVYRYSLTGGEVGRRETFGNVIDRSRGPGFRGPDGMAHDVDGNLYVTVFNQGEVVVLDRNGQWIERLPTHGSQPTNVAFGPGSSIYVTERETGTLQRMSALAEGLPLHTALRSG